MSEKKRKKLLEIGKEFSQWKKEYNVKCVPNNLSKKKQKAWLIEVYLAKQGKEIMISGGGRVLLWLAVTNNGTIWRKDERGTWAAYLKHLIKKERWDKYLEVLKFRFREKLLGLDLINQVEPDYLIENRLVSPKGLER